MKATRLAPCKEVGRSLILIYPGFLRRRRLDVRGNRAAFFGARLFDAKDTLYKGKGRVYFADFFANGTATPSSAT